MCFARISGQLWHYTALIDDIFITEMKSVYCAVRAESLTRTDYVRFLKSLAHMEQTF